MYNVLQSPSLSSCVRDVIFTVTQYPRTSGRGRKPLGVIFGRHDPTRGSSPPGLFSTPLPPVHVKGISEPRPGPDTKKDK